MTNYNKRRDYNKVNSEESSEKEKQTEAKNRTPKGE